MTLQTKIRFVALLIATILCGCTSHRQRNHPVSARAPADLSCPEADVKYTPVDDNTMDVKGCGRRATYVEHCESRFNAAASATMGMYTSREVCQWVLQSGTPDQLELDRSASETTNE